MTRVKRGYVARRRRRSILLERAGSKGAHSILFRNAQQQNMKAMLYSQKDRKDRKRNFRALWVTRINAAIREQDLSYSKFIFLLKNKKILLNRKMLAQISILDIKGFKTLLDMIN
uniref:Large ribosomal subunit protein bL20c n=1 Tax=Nitella hyalina TaxID=181804 RepID=A0A2H4G554_NITHY|nr:ribosomal protein L20 [Nitella hyalina]APP89442.1 ribosomal protein L20 [Nitella hyalina]WKT08471.1 ribosomal protein L20 [Nitella hyalina]